MLFLALMLFAGTVLAVDDATVQAIQDEATTAKNKANQNATEIQNMKGGLPAESAARIAADDDLQNQIDNIQLIPGPPGPPGPQGKMVLLVPQGKMVLLDPQDLQAHQVQE